LVAVDISPAKGPISKSFQVYIDGFKEINSRSVSSRKEADEILTKYEPVPSFIFLHFINRHPSSLILLPSIR
jgi:hypothetical protein